MRKSKLSAPLIEDFMLDARHLRSSANYIGDELFTDFDQASGVSLTVPDQTFTIREQLQRFQGGTLHGLQGQFMDPDDDAPDFSKMETLEIIQWRETALIQQQEITDRFRAASAELAKKHDDDRFEAAVAARVASVTPPSDLLEQ